jgi:hypothetical protein
MSPRNQLALDIARVIVDGGLTQPFGGDVSLVKQPRPHYSVAFSKPRILDGSVEVYAPMFVVVSWETAIRDLPHRGKRVYTADNAKRFIQLAFVEHKFQEAEAIPVAR